MKTVIPKKFNTLFWDYNINSIDEKKHRKFIVERFVEKGNTESLKWIFKKYKKSFIWQTIKKCPNISPKTRNFWTIVLDE